MAWPAGVWDQQLTAVELGTVPFSIPSAHLTGMHPILPGHGPNGPALEIFGYDPMTHRGLPVAGTLRVVHGRDPEGNILELHTWS